MGSGTSGGGCLKNVTPIQLQDLHVGDRILVAEKASDNTNVITATSVVVMKRAELRRLPCSAVWNPFCARLEPGARR